MENNYMPNSHAFKAQQAAEKAPAPVEEKKFEKIIDGTARVHKKSGFRKAIDSFISDDVPNIKTYFVQDVLIPTGKKLISEMVDFILFGRSRRSSGSTLASKVSYNRFYEEPRRRDEHASRPAYSYDEVVVSSRGEAERVLSQMNDIIDTYEMASVGDLYDLVGISGQYTDQRYGWTNISNAEIVRLRDGGYLLQMPKAIPIKR